ncbi:MAG: UDP-N-acetylmuramoyl-L-alanine--D-glutamate ligase [bacterium]
MFGLGVAGMAVANALHQRGETVILADDEATQQHQDFARALSCEFVDLSNKSAVPKILERVHRLAPAPGISENHHVITTARQMGLTISSELELAYNIEEQRNGGPRPMLGITGTDGKTTTTLMTAAMLHAAGHKSMAVGNTDTPLIAALETDTQVFAVECSSFRLANCEHFRTRASVWLNLAPDHLDWHDSMESYAAAKAQLWAHTKPGDIAVSPVDDALILRIAQESTARTVTFGAEEGDYHAQDGRLNTPHGSIMNVSEMKRSMPHDITNALAAAAISIESGLVEPSHVARALSEFDNAPHRIEFVEVIDGVKWFNDSKATSPHASAVAIRSFQNIVLIAGGRNKDLDLSELADQPERVKSVVAIGDDAQEIEKAFDGVCRVVRGGSMKEAVRLARTLAKSGDVVLLSPACTSYDWYNNYMERGEDFKQCVRNEAKLKQEQIN